MNSKLLNFLIVLACATLIGLGPLHAQSPAGSSDANGSAVTAPAKNSNATHSDLSPSSTPDATRTKTEDDRTADSRQLAEAAVDNDRGIIPTDTNSLGSRFSIGWIGLFGLLGLLGLIRRRTERQKDVEPQRLSQPKPEDYRRAA